MDFAGRSLKMTANPAADADLHAGQARSVRAAFGERGGTFSTPEQIAEVTYPAAIDGTSQLRNIAGEDARGILSAKARMSEADFATMIQKNSGVERWYHQAAGEASAAGAPAGSNADTKKAARRPLFLCNSFFTQQPGRPELRR